ncbi:hypothetical protein CSKR_114462 [Clonorchis sinensis]|uniref:Protein asteroid homolog 1 n=2 Tax=Clonorchis sinensis TaxID=79923 RepID=H2KTA8_CLOSI|nr:hypothetical protein CSKR_114462 [Clonorchis sinensis]GAA33831.2 protein asteroid homolog 1 [Clonorchis sinensis]
MPIPGLTAILESMRSNFQPFRLQNTKVIINANDFVYAVMDKADDSFDLEPIGLYLSFKKILTVFDKCGITPYFVFNGGNEKRGRTLDLMVQKQCVNMDKDAEDSPSTSDFHCSFFLSKHVLLSVLRDLNICFTVMSPVVRATAALSAQLKCPVLGSCSDYFILVPSNALSDTADNGSFHRFVPLNYIDFKPDTEDSSSVNDRCFLSAKLFDWQRSTLSSVAPQHRILLVLLMGSNTMPQVRLPPELHKRICAYRDKSRSKRELRFYVIRDWLSQFAPNSKEPVERIIDAQLEAHRDQFIQQLADCIPGFTYNLEHHSHLLTTALNLPEPCPNVMFGELCLSDAKVQSVSLRKSDIHALLSGIVIPHLELPNFTVGWPSRFLKAFHEGKILTTSFQPLYGHWVMFAGLREGYSKGSLSYMLRLPIRVMRYRLIVGFERQLGGCDKLVGLNPHVTEYLPCGNKLVSLTIPIDAINPDPSLEQTDHVFYSLLGITLPTDPRAPGWMVSLAVTIAYCRAQWSLEGNLVPPYECSLTLALVACAVVSFQTDECSLDHYAELCNALEAKFVLESSLLPFRDGLSSNLITIYFAYTGLWSLLNLIESIMPPTHESKLLHFLPLWRLFPSCCLQHWFAVELQTHPPEKRYQVAIRELIPRLYRNTNRDGVSNASELQALESTFSQALQTIVSLNMSPINPEHTLQEVKPHISNSKQDRASHSPSALVSQQLQVNRDAPSPRFESSDTIYSSKQSQSDHAPLLQTIKTTDPRHRRAPLQTNNSAGFVANHTRRWRPRNASAQPQNPPRSDTSH